MAVEETTAPSAAASACRAQLFHLPFTPGTLAEVKESLGSPLRAGELELEPSPCPLLQVWLCHVAPRGGEDQGGSDGELFPQRNLQIPVPGTCVFLPARPLCTNMAQEGVGAY